MAAKENHKNVKDNTKIAILVAIITACAAILAAFIALIPWFVEWGGWTTTELERPVVSIERLCEIELNLTPPIDERPARHTNLVAYFKEANPELFTHLESLGKVYSTKTDHKGATYIAGGQGVGKSYLVRQLVQELKILPANSTTDVIDLDKLLAQPGFPFATEESPDLQSLDGAVVFNVLRRLSKPQDFDMDKFLTAAGARQGQHILAFILLDALDEIHADSAKLILREIEQYVAKGPEGFVHFIVFGRPEGFWPWLKHPDRTPPANVTNDPFVLQPPVFKSTGDLEFRCKDYFNWKYKKTSPDSVTAEFQDRVNSYSFLRNTIFPLAAGDFVLEDCILWHKSGMPERKPVEEIRNALFSDLISRNKDCTGRPSTADAQYMYILERSAAFAIERKRDINKYGYFEVYAYDYISFRDAEGEERKVRLREVLNRSGIAFLDPAELQRTRYRFDPFWIQAHLVERWNQRNHIDHVYRWCVEK